MKLGKPVENIDMKRLFKVVSLTTGKLMCTEEGAAYFEDKMEAKVLRIPLLRMRSQRVRFPLALITG